MSSWFSGDSEADASESLDIHEYWLLTMIVCTFKKKTSTRNELKTYSAISRSGLTLYRRTTIIFIRTVIMSC